jgi:predicted GIY-YIG superfamily endonuclease
VRLVWSEPWPDRASASRREAALKRLPRAAKLALARD